MFEEQRRNVAKIMAKINDGSFRHKEEFDTQLKPVNARKMTAEDRKYSLELFKQLLKP